MTQRTLAWLATIVTVAVMGCSQDQPTPSTSTPPSGDQTAANPPDSESKPQEHTVHKPVAQPAPAKPRGTKVYTDVTEPRFTRQTKNSETPDSATNNSESDEQPSAPAEAATDTKERKSGVTLLITEATGTKTEVTDAYFIGFAEGANTTDFGTQIRKYIPLPEYNGIPLRIGNAEVTVAWDKFRRIEDMTVALDLTKSSATLILADGKKQEVGLVFLQARQLTRLAGTSALGQYSVEINQLRSVAVLHD